MQAFLQPLTEEEEAVLLDALSGKNEQMRTKAKQKLIEHNLRLVAHIVRKYQLPEDCIEDFISIGTIGLMKAVETYDCRKGIRLATYAARCIDNELLMTLRGRKKLSKEVSIYEPIGTDREGNEITLIDVIKAGETDVVQDLMNAQYISVLYQTMQDDLSQRERQILFFRYGLGDVREMTQKEIGKMLGISRSYVSRIEKKALTKLKKALEQRRYATF